jgi:hypothetical protein
VVENKLKKQLLQLIQQPQQNLQWQVQPKNQRQIQPLKRKIN